MHKRPSMVEKKRAVKKNYLNMYKKHHSLLADESVYGCFFVSMIVECLSFQEITRKRATKGDTVKRTRTTTTTKYIVTVHTKLLYCIETLSLLHCLLIFSVAFIRGSWLMLEIHKTNNKFNGNKYAFQFRI